jgi:hypothetical protein
LNRPKLKSVRRKVAWMPNQEREICISACKARSILCTVSLRCLFTEFCGGDESPFLTEDLAALCSAAELDVGAMKEPAGLESSVGAAERLSREVCSFLAKVRSTLIRVRDTSIPDSLGDTMAGILEALAVKPDGEDPLVATVHQ